MALFGILARPAGLLRPTLICIRARNEQGVVHEDTWVQWGQERVKWWDVACMVSNRSIHFRSRVHYAARKARDIGWLITRF